MIVLDSVDRYNRLFGLETLHPMVAVVDLSQATVWPRHFKTVYGIYALFLKESRCGDITYGRQPYDYGEGTIVCFAPGRLPRSRCRRAYGPRLTGCFSTPTSSAAPRSGRR